MKNVKKIALLSRHNAYVGREFAQALLSANIRFDFIQFGNFKAINEEEDIRCGKLWDVPTIKETDKCKLVRFESIKTLQFKNYIIENKITLAIQGGVEEIINKEIIDIFSDGILNFHPGDLPDYRGCSAPEWQIYNSKRVVCTCHFIDTGIDTGNIIEKKILDISEDSYEMMRASIYPEISKFVVKLAKDYLNDLKLKSVAQTKGTYWPYIGEEKISKIKLQMTKKS